MKKMAFVTTLVVALGLGSQPASADLIRVINAGVSGHSMVQNAVNNLNNLGHTVSTGGTLGDYSGFDQVWDLRYNAALGGADIASMGAYLGGGGRLYMTGEHQGFDALRNTSLIAFLGAVGGGTLVNQGGFFVGSQAVTAAGQVVNSPNPVASVAYNASLDVGVTAGNGFLVTETPGGIGSMVGWNFGDIAGASNARMLVTFDIEVFQNANGPAWTENMATYLGGAPVPEPASLTLFGLGLMALAARRRRKS